MFPINRCGYGFADLFYDFTGDFFVFYLRGLHGLYFNSHFNSSFNNITDFYKREKRKEKGEKSRKLTVGLFFFF